jgi:hypothetical protein
MKGSGLQQSWPKKRHTLEKVLFLKPHFSATNQANLKKISEFLKRQEK